MIKIIKIGTRNAYDSLSVAAAMSSRFDRELQFDTFYV